MSESKAYQRRSLTTSCPLKYFSWTNAGKTDKSTSRDNFQFSAQNCSEWKEASNCYRERRRIDSKCCLSISWEYNDSEQPTSTFLHVDFVMRKLKYSMQDRQKPFFEFQQTAAVEICVKFRYKSFLKSCLYSTWFTFIEFVFKLVVACFFELLASSNTHGGSLLKGKGALWIQVTGSAF